MLVRRMEAYGRDAVAAAIHDGFHVRDVFPAQSLHAIPAEPGRPPDTPAVLDDAGVVEKVVHHEHEQDRAGKRDHDSFYAIGGSMIRLQSVGALAVTVIITWQRRNAAG